VLSGLEMGCFQLCVPRIPAARHCLVPRGIQCQTNRLFRGSSTEFSGAKRACPSAVSKIPHPERRRRPRTFEPSARENVSFEVMG
jgi:hypothetical protein